MANDLHSQLMEQKMKVDFNSYDLSVKELISMVKDGYIDIAPDYQRRFRWDEERQSSLIESLFLGVPVPSVFMATNSDGTWELIDGVQRVSTILHFAGDDEERNHIFEKEMKPLRLSGLRKLTLFNNMCFADLPNEIQIKFKLTSLKITVLSDKSDKAVRFDLFERLNRGGISLSDQEIRSCVYRGRFNDFIQDLSKDEHFKRCVHITDNQEADGTREELVLRFFAYLYDIDNFSHSVRDFLNNYMDKTTKNSRFKYAENEQLFRSVFAILDDALPNGISKGRRNSPLNLYEAVAVGAARAYKKKNNINTNGIQQWIIDKELIKYTTGATNTKANVVGRIEYCQRKFEG